MDAREDFCLVTVNQGYDAAATSITIAPGDANLPKVLDPAVKGAYQMVWWNSTTYPIAARDPNVELVRVTSKSGNVLTVTRGQGITTATTKNAAGCTYSMQLAMTKKYLDDIDDASVDIGAETKYVTEKTSTGGAGAVGDGVTNDTTAVQDHCTNGNYIVFPPGTYLISAEITLHSNMYIEGNGIGVTTIKLANSSGAVNMLKGTSASNVHFKNLTVDGNKTNNGTALDGVVFVSSNDVIFENCEVKNVKGHGLKLGAGSSLVDGSRAISCDGSGIYVDADNCRITQTIVNTNVVGITVNTGADDTLIDACYFSGNTTTVTNNGTNTHARNNRGWKTATRIVSSAVAVDGATGTKTTGSVAHGLAVTPTVNDCAVSFVVGNGDTTVRADTLRIASADATNVVADFATTVAGGASAT